MTDLFTSTPSQQIFSVTEISNTLKRMVESQFSNVSIKAEISAVKIHTSGHVYFALKDNQSVIDAVCWRGTYGKLNIKPEEGMEAICKGRLTTFPGRSKYQIVVEDIEPAGEGALLKLLEERKRMLAAEGLFAAERKKPLPFLPEKIGVITSETGAVIRDILHRLKDRCPRHVIVWPTPVQGKGADEKIINAIQGFNSSAALRPDLIIIARGGGSLEDLWEFNSEALVRAVAESDVPIISAVGHETDTTLIDYAADRRAPTPTAAAEMAVPVLSELLMQANRVEQHLTSMMMQKIKQLNSLVTGLARALISPRRIIENYYQVLDDRFDRIVNAIRVQYYQKKEASKYIVHRLKRISLLHDINQLDEKLEAFYSDLGTAWKQKLKESKNQLNFLSGLLDSYSHGNVLKRGYAIVRSGKESPITSIHTIEIGQKIDIQLTDGIIDARVQGKTQ
jgi:exodeoxyribonuclease VII large subunit